MHRRDDLLGLLTLHQISEPKVRRQKFCDGIESLAALGRTRPAPLEGLNPIALEASAKVALQDGLIQEWDWYCGLAPALFDLMNSVPRGTTKRELARRILQILYRCDALTFVTLARSLAHTTPKALASPQIQARIALCLQLPYGLLPQVDGLALALISNPSLAQRWLIESSSGGLAGRRLAARLLERAAREVWREHREGKTVGLRIFRSSLVSEVWRRLLMDRESLTWRHVASARGILVDLIPELDEEIQKELTQEHNPWLWPPACTSLAASIAIRNQVALARCTAILSERVQQSPSIAPAFLYGVVSAAAFEVECAQALCTSVAEVANLQACEVISEIHREEISATFTGDAVAIALVVLREKLASKDDGEAAFAGAIMGELLPRPGQEDRLPTLLSQAMKAFVEEGADGVVAASRQALARAQYATEALQENTEEHSSARRMAYSLLRELDRELLENSALAHLLHFHKKGEAGSRSLGELRHTLTHWLLADENGVSILVHPAWTLAKRKVLVHLVDSDESESGKEDELRKRREESISQVSNRITSSKERADRSQIVVLARACDGAVRESCYELSDMVLAVLPRIHRAVELKVFSEAILRPCFRALCGTVLAFYQDRSEEFPVLIRKSEDLVDSLPWAGTPRVEAFRAALVEVNQKLRRLETLHREGVLSFGDKASPLQELASACQWLAQLTSGARRRLGFADQESAPFLGTAIGELDTARSLSEQIPDELEGCKAVAQEELPEIFARLVGACLSLVTQEIFLEPSPNLVPPTKRIKRGSAGLPAQRNYAGFHLLRTLGDGGAGTVFLACREEACEQDEPACFALKLPVYADHHSEVLSQEDFIAQFRKEAGTLLTLPAHPNLAGFISFDLGAMPTPVLVMEYIAGPHLGICIEEGVFSMKTALEVLDGVAAGLQVMHRNEVGHLDLKPENIVLREMSPVLVDFGLAGRYYQPGRSTIAYGAPEVLIGKEEGNAMQADVYSFCCLAFELLTGCALFTGESVQEIVGKHLIHDGTPAELVALSKSDPTLLPLTQILARGLRREPNQRSTITTFRADLKGVLQSLSERNWPLGQ